MFARRRVEPAFMSRVDEPHEPVPVQAEFPQTGKVVELRLAHLAAEFTNRVDEPAAPTSLPREDQVALRLLGDLAGQADGQPGGP